MMSSVPAARAAMSAAQAPTVDVPLSYDAKGDYNYPVGYDAESFVPAVASMTPA